MKRSSLLMRLAALSVSGLTLAACATPILIPETERHVACKSFRTIDYSRLHDTEQTIIQVREHNAVYEALCGKNPQP